MCVCVCVCVCNILQSEPKSCDGTVLSVLTRSISPAADNVQHYITGIKYSGAQYNQVNVVHLHSPVNTQGKKKKKTQHTTYLC